jgi:hypothetical protein
MSSDPFEPEGWDRLRVSVDTGLEIIHYMDKVYDPSNHVQMTVFPGKWHGVDVVVGIGRRIGTGAFKIHLEGYHDGEACDKALKFIGYLKPTASQDADLKQIDVLIASYVETRIHDKVYNDSMCRSRIHGVGAEDRYQKNMVIDPSYEQISLLVTNRCRTCLIAEKQSTPDFASLIPEADKPRSWV